MLILKFGPDIVQFVLDIWNLIKKLRPELQPKYKAELLYACQVMRKNKIQGNNALIDLRHRVEAVLMAS